MMQHILFTTTCLFGISIAAAALAQDDDLHVIGLDEVAHKDRTIGDVDADITLSYGGYVGTKYRSNIYKENRSEENDIIGIVAPALAIRSDFDEHEVNAKFILESGTYFSNSENSYVDADLQVGGRYDITEEEYIDVSGRFRYDHVEVGGFTSDANSAVNRADEPTPYRYGEVGATYHAPIADAYFGEAGLIGSMYNYDNINRLDGTRLIQDDRDRYELLGNAKLGYHYNRTTKTYIEVEANTRQYDEQVDSSALVERDSDGFGIFVGGEYNIAYVDGFWAEGRIGYRSQDYTNNFQPDTDTIGLDGKIGYQLDDRTLLRADARRDIRENTTSGASGHIRTHLRGRVNHEVTEAWELDGALSYTINDFQINPQSGRQSRVDDIYTASAGATYMIQDPLYTRLDYEYTQRDSDLSAAEFDDNTVMLSVGLNY